jgi:hypothetical protein
MKHQPFEEWLLNEKLISPKQKLELDAHLRVCSYCSALAETGKVLHSVKRVSPAAGFTARFESRLAARKAADLKRKRVGTLLFTFGGLVMLIWILSPFLASFLVSPATWIAALIEWIVFLFTTAQAIAQAGSVVLRMLPGFLSPFAFMVLVSALAGIGLLWSVSIWRFVQKGAPRGV